MKCVLLALALVCAVQAISIPKTMHPLNEQSNKNWKVEAIAADESAFLKSSPFVTVLEVIDKDNVKITFANWQDNKCVEKTTVATKTDNAGFYNIKFLDLNEAVVMVSNNEKEAIVCMQNTNAPKKVICQFLVPVQDENSALAQEHNSAPAQAKNSAPAQAENSAPAHAENSAPAQDKTIAAAQDHNSNKVMMNFVSILSELPVYPEYFKDLSKANVPCRI